MSHPDKDLERLKLEYQQRDIQLKDSAIYSSQNIAYLFAMQQRQKATIDLLHQLGKGSLETKQILEIGSGRGDVMQEWLFHRMDSQHLYGAELLPDRLEDAQQRFQGVQLSNADGQALPFAAQSFDIVLQYTVFSSILDDAIKANIAREMLRVVKADGFILWYDFWLNPTNPQTKGIRIPEIKRLFPNCHYTFRRITLAPPITRKLVPISWLLSLMLEKCKFLNTHYLVLIQPN